MVSDRRTFLQSMGGAALLGGVVSSSGAVRATTSTTSLSGQVTTDGSGEIIQDEIIVKGGGKHLDISTDSEGRFEAEVPTHTSFTLAFYKANSRSDVEPVQNQVPHVYELGTTTVGSEPVDMGTLELPRAHIVDLRLLKPDGEPLRGSSPDFRYNGWGMNGGRLNIDSNGYTTIKGASFTGIEATGNITAEFQPPVGPEYSDQTYTRTVSVDNPIELVATVDGTSVSWSVEENSASEEPATPNTSTITASGKETPDTQTVSHSPTATPTATRETPIADNSRRSVKETNQNRGFLSNGPESQDFEFMTDPFFMTVSGFVLSTAGILHQLVRGE